MGSLRRRRFVDALPGDEPGQVVGAVAGALRQVAEWERKSVTDVYPYEI